MATITGREAFITKQRKVSFAETCPNSSLGPRRIQAPSLSQKGAFQGSRQANEGKVNRRVQKEQLKYQKGSLPRSKHSLILTCCLDCLVLNQNDPKVERKKKMVHFNSQELEDTTPLDSSDLL